MSPDLELKIDIKSDIENAKSFVRGGSFIDWFLPSDLRYIKDKKLTPSKRDKIITEYTKEVYKTKEKEIIKDVEDTKRRWAMVKDRFYRITDDIFYGYDWPKGKYTGSASIYLMFPRDIKEKFFSFRIQKPGRIQLG
ncbi:MAG: hypothetical protein HY764_04340 [Candidatus Portnoybacteria bacterium]|nr:hypothetical protein [Candidatus Portnoybacteria bacterium]